MITQFRHPLVPDSVAAGKFPAGDEDRMVRLGETWAAVSARATAAEDDARQNADWLFGTWSGDAATTAETLVVSIRKWIVEVGSQATRMSAGCGKAAAYLLHTKTAINNILKALANITTKAVLAGLANPLEIPRLTTEVAQSRVWARAQIIQYYSALTTMLGGLDLGSTLGALPTSGGPGPGKDRGQGKAAPASAQTPVRLVPATKLPSGEPIKTGDIAMIKPDQTVVLKDGTELPPQPEAPTTQAAGAPSISAVAAATRANDLWTSGFAPVENASVITPAQIGGAANTQAVKDAQKEEKGSPSAKLDQAIQRGDVVAAPTEAQTQQVTENIEHGTGEAQATQEGVAAAEQQVTAGRDDVSYQNVPKENKAPDLGYTPEEPEWSQDRQNHQGGQSPANAPQGQGPQSGGGGGGDGQSHGGQSPSTDGIPQAGGGTGGGTGGGGGGAPSDPGTSHGTFGGPEPDNSGTSTGTGATHSTGGGGGTTAGGSSSGGTSGGAPTSGAGLPDLSSQGTEAAGVTAPPAPMPLAGMPGAMPGGVPGGMPGGVAGAPMGGSYGNTPLLGGSGFGGPAAPSVGAGGLGAPAPAAAPVSAPMAGGGIPAAPAASGGAMGQGIPGAPNVTPGSGAGPVAPSTSGAPAPAAVVNQPGIGPNQQGQPTSSAGAGTGAQAPAGAADTRGSAGAGLAEAAITVGAAIAALGLAGAAATHFSHLWSDLRASRIVQPTGGGVLPTGGGVLPTQFGPDDQQTAVLPAGLSGAYQKVLLPGEAEALLDGQVATLRGLVHPLDQVAHLATPSDLYAALGLGFAVTGRAGADSLAFNRDASSIEVLRFAGLRLEDLITPVEADVTLPADTVPLPLVRRHARPWTGTGEAPGSTSTDPIDEHEILGYAAVPLPHLAEIWRLNADGTAEYVSTYNARNASWVGSTAPARPSSDRFDNGAFATLADGNIFEIVPLTDQYTILVARGPAAEGFQVAQDGTSRIQVANEYIVAVTGVTTIGSWQGLPVQLVERSGGSVLVDYAGDDPAAAAAAGFLQVNQGQWQPRWVAQSDIVGVQTLERPYALPVRSVRPVDPQAAPPQPPPHLTERDDDRLGV